MTDEMLALPKWRFMVIGILEALGVASGMSAAGIAISVLSECCNLRPTNLDRLFFLLI